MADKIIFMCYGIVIVLALELILWGIWHHYLRYRWGKRKVVFKQSRKAPPVPRPLTQRTEPGPPAGDARVTTARFRSRRRIPQ
jgi:hypothetical protein